MSTFLEVVLLILIAPIFSTIFVTFRAIFIVPLWGTLVRFRATFTPKGLSLDEEDTRVGPAVKSMYGMFQRVRALEGYAGLYKGMIPYILLHTITFSVTLILLGAGTTVLPSGAPSFPNPGGLRMGLVAVLITLITLPFTVLLNRAITTPYVLSSRFTGIRSSLRLLFTPHERSKPWVLYLTPGLLASTAIYITWTLLFMRLFRHILLPGWGDAAEIQLPDPETGEIPDDPMNLQFATWRYVFFFLFQALSTPLLTPLEVIATRLSLQRNHAPSYSAAAPEAEDLPESGVEYFAEGEDVVGFVSEDEPYVGLMDCITRIYEEEGWPVLARGWWVTASANLLRGFP